MLAAPKKRALDAPPLGLRERNKLDKLNRIKSATQDLFLQHGFDDTTTREIARVADVGLGTLFSYAADKRDLLFLIVNDELEILVDQLTAMPPKSSLVKQLHEFAHRHFEFFARQPSLSRLMLREQQYYADTTQANRFHINRDRARQIVVAAVRQAKAAGVLASRLDVDLAARLIFLIYQMEVREWLANEPLDLKRGLASFDRSMKLLLRGMLG